MANPNGAILDDDAEVAAMRKQRFEAWKKGKRKVVLPENGWTKLYATAANADSYENKEA